MERLLSIAPIALLALVFCFAWSQSADQAAAQAPEFGADFDFENDFGGDEPSPAEVTAMIIIAVIGAIVGLAVALLILYLLYSLLRAVPSQHRIMEPAMVWLLLIPCFNIIWNFFVYQRISASYKNYFNSIGRTDVGDCGGQLGLWYAICVALACIPCVNYIAGPAALVLMIIYMVKLFGLKKQLEAKPGFAGA